MKLEQKILLSVLSLILIILLMVKIDLVTADVGRHIKNGEIMFVGSFEARSALLTTNYYSYTEGDAPFVNHHWLSGVVFYIVSKLAGFSGLSVLYIALMLAAFLLVFDLIRKRVSTLGLTTISLIAIPVIASRAEVRPEVVTYLLVVVFIWICSKYTENEIDKKWLWSLPILELVWVNAHIGFILGPFIIGAYLVGFVLKKDLIKASRTGLILFTASVATLANPSFIHGVLYPFKIFGVYTYRVFENQSILFLSNLGVGNVFTFSAYEVLVVIVLISYALAVTADWRRISVPIFIISSAFAVMGLVAIRDFPLFGLIGVVAFATNLSIVYERGKSWVITSESFIVIASVLLILAGSVFSLGLFASRSERFGIGVESGVNNAVSFFKENNIKGPIFNNYDIGGYLIYNLFPDEKVYFDNRPEAYSKKFVSDEYIRPMEDPKTFNEISDTYDFNAIFYYYRDYTPWGQAFITKTVFDPAWATVYADTSILIMLKRNTQNESVIKKFEIPKESFRISK